MNQVRLRAIMSGSALAALAMLAGCSVSQHDSIVVGAVPDDYRTNHPITIAEKEQVLDLPVAASGRGISRYHKTALEGFFAAYDIRTGGSVSIIVPTGGANDLAASEAAYGIAHYLTKIGIPRDRIASYAYHAGSPDASAPVRVAYATLRASTDKCGRWSDDLLNNAENKHYANFGCSYQNNLAAQIANPADLLGPRKTTTIDAENRGSAIDAYKNREISNEFLRNSEVNY